MFKVCWNDNNLPGNFDPNVSSVDEIDKSFIKIEEMCVISYNQ